MPIDIDRLKVALRYEPETGLFVRLQRASNWPAGSVAGSIQSRDGYVMIRVLGARSTAHRLAWFYMTGEWPAGEIDHINRVRSDNRWANLREVTRFENMQNIEPRDCVFWDPRKGGRWYAVFQRNGKSYYAGSSRLRDEALRLMRQKRREVESTHHPIHKE